MFQFSCLWWALLLPLPLLVRMVLPSVRKVSADEVSAVLLFPSLDRLKSAFYSESAPKSSAGSLFYILMALSWLFLILALMQPEKVDQFLQVKNQGHDLIVAVDTSSSMQAVDFSTPSKVINRLDAVKDVVGKFVANRHGDRVGLIIFGEKAYLYVPLTLDTLSVSKMLNHTVSGMAGNATAIGDAIGLSVKSLRDRPEGSRVLILLTDGADNTSSIPPLEAAKLAVQYGIRIYTIGVGKSGLVPFPTQFGGYSMANVAIDEELLREIASLTGGQYFHATDQRALESIYEKIDQLETTEANETLFLIREPLYYYPLACAMASLLALSLYLMMHRPRLGDLGSPYS